MSGAPRLCERLGCVPKRLERVPYLRHTVSFSASTTMVKEIGERERESEMKLTGIHILLSYRCTDECDHCFLWSSPQARGTMTLAQIQDVLHQASELGRVEMVHKGE